ncbi:hypothetical protein PFISCL1PPCAC_16453, partial [Pristionchus fissidentatus]
RYGMSSGDTPYFATYAQDLEQDPFDAINFVERIVWRITGSETIGDPVLLKIKLEEEIASLQMLCDQFSQKLRTLEQAQSAEKREYVQKMQKMYDQNSEAINKIKQLDVTMQNVSSKVIHLGDQLESVNAPRQRAHDTQQLITHFNEFLSDQPLNSHLFTDPDKLLESADLIHKLHSISQELSKEKYAAVQARIAHRYAEVEQLLMDEFMQSQRDEKRMAAVARVLCEFKGYSACVERYIEFLCANFGRADRSEQIYEDALQLVKSRKSCIESIFPQPQTVIQKLVLFIFTGKLKDTIQAKLNEYREAGETERYLVGLAKEFTSTRKLCRDLEGLHLSCDASFLKVIMGNVFTTYLQTYERDELAHLRRQCTSILTRFYEDKKHSKKAIQTGDKLSELKRDAQARFLTVEDYGGETFLSHDVVFVVLQELKNAYARTALLCDSGEPAARQTEAIFDVMLQYLHHEHLDYAVELALAGISLAEPKIEPPAYIFAVVAQNTTMMHLMTKQFADSVQPALAESMNEQTSVHKKWLSAMRNLESKLNLGIERQMNAIIGYSRFILNQQKKADFVPESLALGGSQACTSICKFLRAQATAMETGLDGENLGAVMSELAMRFYRLLLSHIQQFYYNMGGGMMLVCDLNEYRKLIAHWRYFGIIDSLVAAATATSTTAAAEDAADPRKMFDHLHALANLLTVLPENVQSSSHSAQLDGLSDPSLINTFLQLRVDYRNLKWRP